MRWDDIINVLFELLKQNPREKEVRIVSEGLPTASVLPEGVGGTIIVALSFFHRKIGPLIFYSYPKKQLDNDLSSRIYDIMDQPTKEEFLTQSFEDLKLLNYYFQIRSDWARGSNEMLMLSLLTSQQISPEIEETVSNLCKKFSEKMQTKEDIFTGFHIKELDSYDDSDKERIRKSDFLIKSWVQELYWEVLGVVKKISEEEKFAMSSKTKTKNTILIIDNEPENLNLTEKFLKLGDFETITCNNVNEALKLIEERYNDIVIIILNPMRPGLNIDEFYQFIKSDERYKHILVISTEKADDEGGDLPYPYVFKPPTPPGDLGLAGEPQAKEPITNQVLVYETYCKYCGAKLPKGQTICHVCGKKV